MQKPELSGPYHGATVGLVRTSEQPQKRGPPDAVLPDQADPVAW
jgi:hypothetical protein